MAKSTESYLIVNGKKIVGNICANSRVNVIAEGKRYLFVVIEIAEYHAEYVKDLVNNWKN